MERREYIRRSVELFNAGEFEALAELFAEDAVLQPDPNFPEGVACRGREQIRRFYEGLHQAWQSGDSASLGEVHGSGDKLLAEFVWRATGEASGVETSSNWLGVYSFRDDELVRLEYFSSREAALEAAGL